MAYKNDYSCIVYFGKKEKPKKWSFVHTLDSFENFLNTKHSTWQYFNVYDRRTTKYLKRFYKGNIIPRFLSNTVIILLPLFFLTFSSILASSTFTNGIYNTATIWTYSKSKGGANDCF